MHELGKKVLVVGGAGYVGCVLVPLLLDRGYRVRVLDLYIYGQDVLKGSAHNPRLEQIRGDIRDAGVVEKAVRGCQQIVHLACISNDPSFDLNPDLGKSINFDSFEPLVKRAVDAGVSRFVFASSSSVYGVKDLPEVTEQVPLEPLTDYSKYKAMCEEVLLKYTSSEFVTAQVRPATVCGYSPRQRLDIVTNIFVNYAYNRGHITVFGGDQKRPSIHIADMAGLYLHLLTADPKKISGQIYNAGRDNFKVRRIAERVRRIVGESKVTVSIQESNDPRSYHISSRKLIEELGFALDHTIDEGIEELLEAFQAGKLPDSLSDPRYFNIEMMKKIELK